MSTKNLEVERKILDVNFENIKAKVENIGWILEFTREKFHAIWVENISWVRFRIREEGKYWVRWESKIQDISGYKKEIWIEPKNSLSETLAFANALWFFEISQTIKLRTQWVLQYKNREVRVLVDEFQDLRGLKDVPSLAEIEVIVWSDEVKKGEKIIFEIGDLLWFASEEILKMWETKLFEMYNSWKYVRRTQNANAKNLWPKDSKKMKWSWDFILCFFWKWK